MDTLKYGRMFRSGQLAKLAQPTERLIDARVASARRRCFVFHVQNATVCWLAQRAAECPCENEVTMATAEECRKALEALTGRLTEMDPKTRAAKLSDRTLSCRVTDLGVTFLTRIGPQGAGPVQEAGPSSPRAQIRFSGKSDDIVAVSADPGSFVGAWATRRIKVDASVMDIINLRKLL